MITIEDARVVRRGSCLEIRASGGTSWLVRSIDLWPRESVFSTDPEFLARRFTKVHAADEALVVEYSDGEEEYVPVWVLPRPMARSRGGLSADAMRRLDADLVVENIGLLVTAVARDGDPLGVIPDGALVCGGGHVLWVGARKELARAGLLLDMAKRLDAGGRLVTPGLVDCHSHPIFAGHRADEFALRAAGKSYLEISAAGGGIKATLEPTRAHSFDQHVALAAARMSRALAQGTTTSEAKSGYDLTVDGELRLLEVAGVLDAVHPVDISPTLLGAHALPPEFAGDRRGFVASVCEHMIPRAAAAGLTRCADVYCDEGAFTVHETRTMLEAATRAGLAVRAHVGQFADLGGAELLAELGGLSADHLENVSDAGIAALSRAGVVAVMLPGACVQLGMKPPPVERLRAAGVAMAVATDMNPGTSMSHSLPLQMWLAITHYGMTVTEAWLGVTRLAAQAMGVGADVGSLRPGALADLVVWDAEKPAEIPYHYGVDLISLVIKSGRAVRADKTRSERS